jgi:hypothetical protein
MARLALFCGLVAIVAALNACAAPTSPTVRRAPARMAQEDTGAFCGWGLPNGRC